LHIFWAFGTRAMEGTGHASSEVASKALPKMDLIAVPGARGATENWESTGERWPPHPFLSWPLSESGQPSLSSLPVRHCPR